MASTIWLRSFAGVQIWQGPSWVRKFLWDLATWSGFEGSYLADVLIWCLPTWMIITAAILYIYGSAIIPTQYDFILYMKSLTCQLPQVVLLRSLQFWLRKNRETGLMVILSSSRPRFSSSFAIYSGLRNSRNVVEVILPPKSARKGAQAGLKPDWKCLCHKHHSP